MVPDCVLNVLFEPDLFLIIIKLGLTLEDVFNLYEAFEENPDKELIEGLNILLIYLASYQIIKKEQKE